MYLSANQPTSKQKCVVASFCRQVLSAYEKKIALAVMNEAFIDELYKIFNIIFRNIDLLF